MKRKEKIKEYKRAAKKELAQILQNKKEQLARLKFELTVGKVKNIRAIRAGRRDIARIKTVLSVKLKQK